MAINKVQSGLQVNPQGGGSGDQFDIPDFQLPSNDELASGDPKFFLQLMQKMQQQQQIVSTIQNFLTLRHELDKESIQKIGQA